VDPKTVLCSFFVQGTCKKGDKCRYSHDKNVVRKVEKIDIYTDVRKEEGGEEKEKEKEKEDTMEKWSQDKLEDVVSKKQGSVNKNLQTNIVCKYFLEAIETKKYGWYTQKIHTDFDVSFKQIYPHFFFLSSSFSLFLLIRSVSVEYTFEYF
jgi:hypothetical protein